MIGGAGLGAFIVGNSPKILKATLAALPTVLKGSKYTKARYMELLTLLFEVTDLFDMEARPELLLLQKTMVVVEGVARTLDPAFNMWKTAEPVVGEWIRHNLGPAGYASDAKDGLMAGLSLIRQLPDLSDQAAKLSAEMAEMGAKGFRLDPSTIEQIGKAEARHSRWGHVALWVIAASVVWWVFFQ